MKPTDEQIKEFWEWCGWEIRIGEVKDASGWVCHPVSSWLNGVETALPDIDLNNLFKYAVPRVRKYLNSQSEIDGIDLVKYPFHDFLRRWAYAIAIKNEDSALTLFWAIYEVINAKEAH